MTVPENRLAELGLELPDAPSPIANYVPAVRTGNLLYLSGSGPAPGPDGTVASGKLGADLTVEQGYEAAKVTALNLEAMEKANSVHAGDIREGLTKSGLR
mgnify:CR=1 FL=1